MKEDENEEDINNEQTIKHNFIKLKIKTNKLLYGQEVYTDKSKKGTIDKKIIPLVNTINSLNDYCTLSSCSGRITLFSSGDNISATNELDIEGYNNDDGEEEQNIKTNVINKENSKWYLSSHSKITLQKFQSSLSSAPSDKMLLCQFEPFVLHIGCSCIATAKRLLQSALSCGLRESGLVITNKRITLAIRSTSLSLNIPFCSCNGMFYPGDDYIRGLINEINNRFDLNEVKINKLYTSIKQEFCIDDNNDSTNISMNVCNDIPPLNLYGHSCNTISYNNKDYIVVFGGYGPGPNTIEFKDNKIEEDNNGEIINNKNISNKRCSTIYHLIRNTNEWSSNWIQYNVPSIFTARQGHASCNLSSTIIGVFGGRTNPKSPCSNTLFLYSIILKSFTIDENISGERPSPRWGHSFISLTNEKAMIIGGRNAFDSFNDIYILSYTTNEIDVSYTWSKLVFELPKGLFYSSCCCPINQSNKNDTIFIFGGLSNVNDYYSSFDQEQQRVIELKIDYTKGLHTWRYTDFVNNNFASSITSFGCNNENYIMLTGGITPENNTSFQIIKVDNNRLVTAPSNEIINDSNDNIEYDKLIHHAMVYVPNNNFGNKNYFGEIICVGGGIDTFAFGQSFSRSYRILLQSGTNHNFESSSLSVNKKSISNIISSITSSSPLKNNQVHVIYTLKKNTKKLKDCLLKLNHLDLKYRISHVKLSSSSVSTDSVISTLDTDALKMYVAIPITCACYELCRKEQHIDYMHNDSNISENDNSGSNDDDDNWMSLVFDCGMQEVLLRSSVFGNRN